MRQHDLKHVTVLECMHVMSIETCMNDPVL